MPAEKYNEAVRERIRGEIQGLMEGTPVPDGIRDFLLERWARLLTDIEHDRGVDHPDWEAGWDTVHILLWSLQPLRGPKEAFRLLRRLPLLVERLDDGFRALRLEKSERDPFFADLALLHAALVRAGLHAEDSTNSPSAPSESPGGAPPGAFVASAEAPTANIDDVISGLHLGARFVLTEAAAERLLVLQWISPMGGMYVFTDHDGNGVLSLSEAKLRRKLAHGEARPLVG